MRAARVFISYSHDDEAILNDLLPYLASLDREGLADVWSDRRIKAGDQWRKEIDAALDAATVTVLLISQAFLASPFVRDEELPRILAQQAAGRMTVLPVFVSPSTVRSDSVTFLDASGKEQRIVLSTFQGFGTPEETLLDLKETERQRSFVELHDRLRELATGKPVSRPAPPPVEVPDPPPKRFALGAAVAGAGTIATIVVAFLGWRSMNFKDAVEQFDKGSLAAVRELAGHRDRGIHVLVDGLDATGESTPASFPQRTLKIIEILREHPDAVEKYRADLEDQAEKNRENIEAVATTLEVQLEKDVAVSGEQVEQLEKLAQVAVCMNQLMEREPRDWPELATRVRVLLRELPTCESSSSR